MHGNTFFPSSLTQKLDNKLVKHLFPVLSYFELSLFVHFCSPQKCPYVHLCEDSNTGWNIHLLPLEIRTINLLNFGVLHFLILTFLCSKIFAAPRKASLFIFVKTAIWWNIHLLMLKSRSINLSNICFLRFLILTFLCSYIFAAPRKGFSVLRQQ
jgi:hypothetical protein